MLILIATHRHSVGSYSRMSAAIRHGYVNRLARVRGRPPFSLNCTIRLSSPT
jgi:hypothetical protein